jgi:hypothetical protein
MDELRYAICKSPQVLGFSETKLRAKIRVLGDQGRIGATTFCEGLCSACVQPGEAVGAEALCCRSPCCEGIDKKRS